MLKQVACSHFCNGIGETAVRTDCSSMTAELSGLVSPRALPLRLRYATPGPALRA